MNSVTLVIINSFNRFINQKKAVSEDQFLLRGIAKFAILIKTCALDFPSWTAEFHKKMTVKSEVKKLCIRTKVGFHSTADTKILYCLNYWLLFFMLSAITL